MEDDLFKIGIAIVAVATPTGGVEINFDVARDRRLGAELEDGFVEVGTGLAVLKTGVKDAQFLAVQGFELIAAKALVAPDGLEEAFGRRGGWSLAQNRESRIGRAPASV